MWLCVPCVCVVPKQRRNIPFTSLLPSFSCPIYLPACLPACLLLLLLLLLMSLDRFALLSERAANDTEPRTGYSQRAQHHHQTLAAQRKRFLFRAH